MEKFKITSLAWRKEIAQILSRAGHKSPDEAEIVASLLALAKFLEERGLTVRPLVNNGELVGGGSFELYSTDLTDFGLMVIRAGLGSWEKKGCPSDNLRPLEKAYTKSLGKR